MIPKKKVSLGTDPRILADAESFVGHKLPPAFTGAPDPIESAGTAAEYGLMPHAPHDPQVKASYDAMKAGVKAQWDHLKARGVRFTKWTGKGQPYADSREMARDARENRHLFYYPTEVGFGVEGTVSHHPLLEEMEPGVPYNDAFRAVHDYFGHALHGHQFGPVGEYRAYHEHAQMFPPEAHGALTSETHGQNSWVNYGPHSHLPVTERPYAEQKAGLLPRHAWPKLKLAAPRVQQVPSSATKVTQYAPGMQPPGTPKKPLALGTDLYAAHHVTYSKGGGATKQKVIWTKHAPQTLKQKLLAAGFTVHAIREAEQSEAGGNKWRTIGDVAKLSRRDLETESAWGRAIGATGGLDRATRGAFADWLEERGRHYDEDTLHHLRHHDGPVGVMLQRGKVWAHPADTEAISAARVRRGFTSLLSPDLRMRHRVLPDGAIGATYRTTDGRWHAGRLKGPDGSHEWGTMHPTAYLGHDTEEDALKFLHDWGHPLHLARISAKTISGESIHPAFRGTALAYHMAKLATHARARFGTKANALLRQVRGILAGNREVTIREYGDKVNPFAAVGRYLKQFAGTTVPEELHGYADRFKWTTSDRRHDLDRRLYELIHESHGTGDHGKTDAIVKGTFRKLLGASDETKRLFTDRLRKHLKGGAPGDYHQEVLDSLGRLRGYALDRETVAAGGGKTKGGNVHWRDWFEGAANPYVKKQSDPMRLNRGH